MWCRLASNFYECVKSSSMYLDGPNSNWFSLSQSWTELEHWLNFATFKGPVGTHCGPPSSPTTHNQVGIQLRPLGNAAYVACLTLLWQGSKWLNGKSVWLVFRRSWVRIPALDPSGHAMRTLQKYCKRDNRHPHKISTHEYRHLLWLHWAFISTHTKVGTPHKKVQCVFVTTANRSELPICWFGFECSD